MKDYTYNIIGNTCKGIAASNLMIMFYCSIQTFVLLRTNLATDWMLDRDPQEEVFKAFRLFDDDETGKIGLRNLRRVARELGENMTDDELRSMIDEFDKDGDGESK